MPRSPSPAKAKAATFTSLGKPDSLSVQRHIRIVFLASVRGGRLGLGRGLAVAGAETGANINSESSMAVEEVFCGIGIGIGGWSRGDVQGNGGGVVDNGGVPNRPSPAQHGSISPDRFSR